VEGEGARFSPIREVLSLHPPSESGQNQLNGGFMMGKDFLFVTCVNNEDQYLKCVKHIRQLTVPEGCNVEYFPVRSASSLASAYNQALDHPATYKIYLHQDTYVIYPGMLEELLHLFSTYPRLGMVGVIGCETLPKSGILWQSVNRTGKLIYRPDTYRLITFGEDRHPYTPVTVIDGLFMACQHHIPWREDLFDGFHFYDISQCLEYKKRGYDVGVVPQPEPWCIHDSNGSFDVKAYEKYRRRFLEHYAAEI
jgi:hypothetical protein